MIRKSRKITSEDELYLAALRALMRRAHSVYEMRQALERRVDDKALARRVLHRLKNEGLLDDARYARQFARFHVESRRQGRFRISRELRARGVPDRHIESALEEAFSETEEAVLVRKRIERKLRAIRGPLDERRMASLFRSLLRAGFQSEVIRAELRVATNRNVEDLAGKMPAEEE